MNAVIAPSSRVNLAAPAPRRRPKIGLHLPVGELMSAGQTQRWADLLAMARLAEDVGFDSLWVADHLIFRSPGEAPGVWECYAILAALAAATSRVELGTLVGSIGFRNPALLAKMADTIDEISGGRLILGLGAGYHEPEFRAFGMPYDHRASRMEEALQIICPLLREGQVDFQGQFYEARECELRPRGPRPQGLPIMLGTWSERMLRLTARYADMWNVCLPPVRELAPAQAALDAACRDVGRDPATVERTALIRFDLPGTEGTPIGLRRHRSGSLEELAGVMRSYTDAGLTHIQVWLHPNTLAGIEAFAPVLDYLDRD